MADTVNPQGLMLVVRIPENVSLNDLAKNRTTLIIAHRLATIRDADYIFVVTPNGIEEQGTYEELVAKGGIFAGLHHA